MSFENPRSFSTVLRMKRMNISQSSFEKTSPGGEAGLTNLSTVQNKAPAFFLSQLIKLEKQAVLTSFTLLLKDETSSFT